MIRYITFEKLFLPLVLQKAARLVKFLNRWRLIFIFCLIGFSNHCQFKHKVKNASPLPLNQIGSGYLQLSLSTRTSFKHEISC